MPTNGTCNWSPELIFGATCTTFRAGAVPGSPGARRGPQGAENRAQIRGQIFHFILPKVCPTPRGMCAKTRAAKSDASQLPCTQQGQQQDQTTLCYATMLPGRKSAFRAEAGQTLRGLKFIFIFLCFCGRSPKTQSANEWDLELVSGVAFWYNLRYFSRRGRSRGSRGPPWGPEGRTSDKNLGPDLSFFSPEGPSKW